MSKLFDIIATEENNEHGALYAGELGLEDVIAVEEATVAVEAAEVQMDAYLAMDADIAAIDTQVANEEAILADPTQITAGTAKMAIATTVMIGRELGAEVSVGMEDSVVGIADRAVDQAMQDRGMGLRRVAGNKGSRLVRELKKFGGQFQRARGMFVTSHGNSSVRSTSKAQAQAETKAKMVPIWSLSINNLGKCIFSMI